MRDVGAGMSLVTIEIKRIDLRYILAVESTGLGFANNLQIQLQIIMEFIGLNHSLSSLLCAFQELVILRLSWRCKPVLVAPDFLFPQAREGERAQVSLPVAFLPDSRTIFRWYHLRPSAYSKTVMASAGDKNASSGTCCCEKGDEIKIISLHRLLCAIQEEWNGFLEGATCMSRIQGKMRREELSITPKFLAYTGYRLSAR